MLANFWVKKIWGSLREIFLENCAREGTSTPKQGPRGYHPQKTRWSELKSGQINTGFVFPVPENPHKGISTLIFYFGQNFKIWPKIWVTQNWKLIKKFITFFRKWISNFYKKLKYVKKYALFNYGISFFKFPENVRLFGKISKIFGFFRKSP